MGRTAKTKSLPRFPGRMQVPAPSCPATRRAGGAVLFLDFDGVLNNYKTIRRFERLAVELRLLDWLDPDLTRMVGAVAAELGALIVVCSSWRDRHDVAKLRASLHARGIPREVDVEACRRGGGKGDAIRAYLHDHPGVTRFAILDDGPDGVMETELQRHLVAPNGYHGVTDEEIERVRDLLRPEAP